MAKYIDIPAIYYGGKELASDRQAQLKYTGISAGASGTNVSTLQEALHELGFYDGDITGIFDTETAQAVKDFQRKNGLLQTGAVSAELQKLIYEGKPVNAKGKKVSVAVLPPIAGIAMQQGDAGYQVEELQAALIDLGYLEGAISGTYDAKTTAAVKKLQKASGLKADGIAGAATLKQIERYLTTPTPKITVVTPTPAPITADNVIVIQKGTRGLVVTRLQERLVALGYYDIEPDGIFNANDVTALKAFQKKNGIKADGIAGLDTQVRLYSDAAVSAWATATPKPAATPKPDLTARLEIGSSGTQVSLLQARLTTLGYFTATIDGRFGTATALAVAEFQSVNGLSADGIAGAQTLKALYASTAKSAIVITPTATPKPSFTALRIGDRGSEVRAVQAMLIELDYLTGAAGRHLRHQDVPGCARLPARQPALGRRRGGHGNLYPAGEPERQRGQRQHRQWRQQRQRHHLQGAAGQRGTLCRLVPRDARCGAQAAQRHHLRLHHGAALQRAHVQLWQALRRRACDGQRHGHHAADHGRGQLDAARSMGDPVRRARVHGQHPQQGAHRGSQRQQRPAGAYLHSLPPRNERH